MDFGEVLSRAWQIIWKHKILWLFGLLAGFGSSISTSTTYSLSDTDFDPRLLPYRWEFDLPYLQGMPNWQIAFIIGLAVLAVVILFVLLGTIGRVGVIRGVQMAEQGAGRLPFNELISEGFHYFWRVFGLNLLVGLLIFVVGFLLALFFVLTSLATLGMALICLLPLLCLLAPAGWFLQIIIEQANVALIVEDVGVIEGLRRGWEVVRKNIGAMLVMGLVLTILIGVIAGLILSAPFGLIALPFIAGASEGIRASVILGSICLVIYLPILLVLTGIWRAYTLSGWTLTYLRLTRGPVTQQEAM